MNNFFLVAALLSAIPYLALNLIIILYIPAIFLVIISVRADENATMGLKGAPYNSFVINE